MKLFLLNALNEFPVCVTEKRDPNRFHSYLLHEIMKEQRTLNLQHRTERSGWCIWGWEILFESPLRTQISTCIQRSYCSRKNYQWLKTMMSDTHTVLKGLTIPITHTTKPFHLWNTEVGCPLHSENMCYYYWLIYKIALVYGMEDYR